MYIAVNRTPATNALKIIHNISNPLILGKKTIRCARPKYKPPSIVAKGQPILTAHSRTAMPRKTSSSESATTMIKPTVPSIIESNSMNPYLAGVATIAAIPTEKSNPIMSAGKINPNRIP